MDMVIVKRNGVFINFPKFECENGDVRDDVISGVRVNKSNNSRKRRNVASKEKEIAYFKVNVGYMNPRDKRKIKVNTKKHCRRCGEECWRSDVNYCWDCYKYEKFESR